MALMPVSQFNLRVRQKGVRRRMSVGSLATNIVASLQTSEMDCIGLTRYRPSFMILILSRASCRIPPDAFVRMLDLTTGGDGEEVYKVLVLDRPCRDIVSPLIRVNDLRKHGVTLHLLLESERCGDVNTIERRVVPRGLR